MSMVAQFPEVSLLNATDENSLSPLSFWPIVMHILLTGFEKVLLMFMIPELQK